MSASPSTPGPSPAELERLSPGDHPCGNHRWLICALLFLATTINYLDRQILSLLKPILDERIGWTSAQFGLINSVFLGAYGIGLLGFGWFVDRYGARIGYAVSISMWSLAAMAHGLVGGVRGFLMARMGLGLGEGGNFPSAIKAVALWFPKTERALATSIFNAGTSIGAVAAPALAPLIARRWSWQGAFVVSGAAGFVWLIFWLWLYKPRSAGLSEPSLAPAAKIPWATLLFYRQTWSFVMGKFLTDPVWWFFLIWLPDYFNSTRGLNITKSWPHLVAIYSMVTVLSILGGWLTGYLNRRGWTVTRSRKTGMFLSALCAMPIVFAAMAGDWGATLLIGLAASAHQAWSANLYTTVSDMFPTGAVASVTGLGGMAGSLGGMIFPYLTGVMLDFFKASNNLKGGYELLFVFCGGAYLLAFTVNHLLAPRFEPVLENRS